MSEASEFANQYKVRLQVANPYTYMAQDIAARRNRSVTFKVSPEVTENRNVNYKTLDPMHMPGQIYVYGATSSRTFQISNIKLVSRTVKEATDNMRILWLLRSWAMPYFGNSSTLGKQNIKNRASSSAGNAKSSNAASADEKVQQRQGRGTELLGAPPDVLLLSAYSPNSEYTTQGQNSSKTRLTMTNIHNVPVVVTNLTIPYPSDVDYIPTEDGQPMPRLMTVDVQLSETHSPQEYNQFSIQDFRDGRLVNF